MTQVPNHPPRVFPTPLPPGVRPHRGTMILVLGILSLVISGCGIGFILGILAWVLGNGDLAEIRAGRMDPAGESPTNAGRICGIVSVVLSALGVGIMLVYFGIVAMIVAAAGSGP